ncbi:hypothetical protein KKH39_04450 [Patescibacteria group bacterium]|nr:hypothetical protein [Patescibacteria group bacterium]
MSNWQKVVKTMSGDFVFSSLGPINGDLGARLKREVDNTIQGQVTIVGFFDADYKDLLVKALETNHAK